MDIDTKKQLPNMLYQELPVMGLILDRDLNIIDINAYGCEQLGYSRSELLGTFYPTLCIPEDREFVQQKLTRGLDELPRIKRWDCSHVRKDGTSYWARDTARFIKDQKGETFILIASEDITETRYLIGELEQKIYVDELTGLYNRRRFNRHLDEIVLSSRSGRHSHALFFIDIDRLKAINDICGHQCGDQLLIQVANLLRKHTRKQDVLARLGGDEFGLILHSCSAEESRRVGEKLLNALGQYRFSWAGRYFSISASIGYTLIDSGTRLSAEELLRQADAACYLAKERGRNRLEMYDTQSTLIQQRENMQSWYSRIKQALDQSRFVLFSQEVVPVSKHAEDDNAHEVLIRMKGSNGEIIPPGAFLPATDYYHLSPKVDLWVLREVIRHFSSLPEPNGVTYYVNLSGMTLRDSEYIEAASGFLPQYLDRGLKLFFEITESVAIHHLNAAQSFIEKFKALGCRFALDDFGSGFSSFGYLKALPVDVIKIDGKFVRQIANDPADQSIVSAINEVSKSLGKMTVAEYVENGATFDILKEMGIDYAQGYYLGEPQPLIGDGR